MKNPLPEEAKTNTKKLSKTAQEFFRSPACKQNTDSFFFFPGQGGTSIMVILTELLATTTT
jgi:hypothetical protein